MTVPANSLVCVAVSEAVAVTAGTLSDGTNSYTAITSELMSTSVGIGVLFYYFYTSPQSGLTLTYTKGGTGDNCSMAAFYATGINSTTPVDSAVTAVAQSTSATPTITSGVPTQSGDLIVAMVAYDYSSAEALTNAGPFAAPFDNVTTQTTAQLGGGNLNVAGSLAVTYAPTIAHAPTGAALIIVGFKPAATYTGWWDVTPWSAAAGATAGSLIRQNAMVAVGSERVFVCYNSTSGTGTTGATEPTWVITRGGQVTDNTVKWQECTGVAALNGDCSSISGATSASSAAGSTTLTFTSTPAGLSPGLYAIDKTATTVIPAGATVVSFTATTVTLSAAITGAGVGSGDTIAFSNTPTWKAYRTATGTATLGQVIQNSAGTLLLLCTVGGAMAALVSEPSWSAYTATGATTSDGAAAVWVTLGAYNKYSAWSAPHARLASALTANWAQAGENVFVADNHAELQPQPITITGAGTVAAPIFIYCVDHTASVPPGSSNLKTTATVTLYATATNVIALNGIYYVYGISFIAGPANGVESSINVSGAWVKLEACLLKMMSTNTPFNFSWTISGAYTEFDNTSLSFGNSSLSGRQALGLWIWKNSTALAAGSAALTSNLMGYNSGNYVFEGVDLTGLNGGITADVNDVTNYQIVNCKLPSGFSLGTPGKIGSDWNVIVSDSGATNYVQQKNQFAGSLVQSTSVVRSSGASDGTTPISWSVTTTTNSSWLVPFQCFLIAEWNTLTGSTRTVTVYGVVNAAAVPNNDQIWLEVEYLGSSATPLGSFANDTKANNLAAGTALTADGTSNWGTGLTARQNSHAYSVGNIIGLASNPNRVFFCTASTGSSAASEPAGYTSAIDGGVVTDGNCTFRAGCRFSMVVTLTAQMVGYIYGTVKAAEASTTFFCDPLLNFS